MLRKLFFAAALGATLIATPALAGPWTYYDGYNVYPDVVYPLPYGYPFAPLAVAVVPVPVITYAPVPVLIYTVPQQPPYYNVPPYAVYAPY